MIRNNEKFFKYIGKWLADYAKDNGRKSFIVYFRGKRIDALLLKSCIYATKQIGGLSLIIHASNEKASDIAKTVLYPRTLKQNLGFGFIGASQTADDNDGILLAPVSKTGALTRRYKKSDIFICDVFPFLDIPYFELYELASSLWENIEWIDDDEEGDVYIENDVLNKEMSLGIITSDISPQKHPDWKYFIGFQKKSISFYHQREKLTRHKRLTDRPYPKFHGEYLC